MKFFESGKIFMQMLEGFSYHVVKCQVIIPTSAFKKVRLPEDKGKFLV